MKKITPELILVMLLCIFLLIFLLPQFSITLPFQVESTSDQELTEQTEQSPESEQSEVQSEQDSGQDLEPETQSEPTETVSSQQAALEWVGLDFDLFGFKSSLANFGKGWGLYPEFTYSYTATNKDIQFFNRDIDLIRTRLDIAGFSDVTLKYQRTTEDWLVTLNFPEYYTNSQSQSLSDLIMSPGEIQFFETDITATEYPESEDFTDAIYQQYLPGFIPTPAEITLSDIKGVSVSSRTEYLLPVIDIEFTADARERIYSILGRVGIDPESNLYQNVGGLNPFAEIPVMTLEVDGIPQFVLIYQYDLTFLAVPLGFVSTPEQLAVITTYFASFSPLASGYSINVSGTVPPIYTQNGKTLMALSTMITIVLLVVVGFRTRKVETLLAGSLAVVTPILIAVSVMKLIATPISTSLVIGLFLMLMILLITIKIIMSQSLSKLPQNIKLVREVSVFLFILLGTLYISGVGFGVYKEFVGLITVMSFSIFLATWIGFKQIFNWYFE